VIVIIILRLLAAAAVPRFANLGTQARIAASQWRGRRRDLRCFGGASPISGDWCNHLADLGRWAKR